MKEKKALLVVSYGTSFAPARERTLEKIEAELAARFPERKFYRAWTSNFLIKKVREKEGLVVNSLSEAVARMHEDGVTDVLAQAVFIIRASESQKLQEALTVSVKDIQSNSETQFSRVRIGEPLLASNEDVKALASIIPTFVPDFGPEQALVLMGHGSAKDPSANRIYVELEEEFVRQGFDNIFISTIDGEPSLARSLEKLTKKQPKKVWLIPLLLVAGDHVVNDMKGDREDSWINQIRQMGFEAEGIPRGIGEYAQVRGIFLAHAEVAEGMP